MSIAVPLKNVAIDARVRGPANTRVAQVRAVQACLFGGEGHDSFGPEPLAAPAQLGAPHRRGHPAHEFACGRARPSAIEK